MAVAEGGRRLLGKGVCTNTSRKAKIVGRPLLDKCKACGKEVSRHGLLCPHCGHPQGSWLAIALLTLFGVLLMALFIAFCFYGMCMCQ